MLRCVCSRRISSIPRCSETSHGQCASRAVALRADLQNKNKGSKYVREQSYCRHASKQPKLTKLQNLALALELCLLFSLLYSKGKNMKNKCHLEAGRQKSTWMLARGERRPTASGARRSGKGRGASGARQAAPGELLTFVLFYCVVLLCFALRGARTNAFTNRVHLLGVIDLTSASSRARAFCGALHTCANNEIHIVII